MTYENKNKEIGFINKLIIQGNSYCVRVPKTWIDKLDLREGDMIDVTIRKPKDVVGSKKLLLPYKKYFPQFKNLSLGDINSCLFYISLESMLSTDKEAIKNFEEKLRREKGKSFLKKYVIFKESIKDKNKMKRVIEDSMRLSKDFKDSFKLGVKTTKENKY